MKQPDMEYLLRINGFELIRNNKHQVWKHPDGGIYTMSNSPSDINVGERRFKNLKKVIEERGREFYTEKPRAYKEEPMNFNSPRIIEEPKPKVPVVKTLDDDALAICKDAMIHGKTQVWMVGALNELGCTTPGGQPLQQKTVSVFMRANGLSMRDSNPVEPRPEKPARKAKSPGLLHDLTDILSSNLSDEIKERLVVSMVKERT